MTKKTSIIVVISIIIILISLLISIYLPNKDKINEEKEDNSISYYLLKKEEQFGVINQAGEIVIEPVYEEIIIPNPHKAVFICKNKEKKILNEKNEEIFTEYDNIEPIKLSNVITEVGYEKKVLKYEKNGKYGLIGFDGKNVVNAKYQEISSLGYKEGQILVKEKDKYGIIDEKGNTIIKNNFDSIISDQYYDSESGYKKSGYIVCNITDDGYRYGYYDYEGIKVLDVEYNKITRIAQIRNNEGIYLIASKNGQSGVFVNNNKIINTQYQSIEYNEETQMFIVERTGKYGVINEKGIEILKTEYTDIQINGIYIYTKKDEEQKVFDRIGKEIELPFDTIIESTKSLEYYIKSEKEKYSILNSNFEEISKEKYKYIEYLYDKYFIATNNEQKSGIIDEKGNTIIEFEYGLIEPIKDKNAIQAIDFEKNNAEVYNSKLEKILEIKNIKIQKLEDYIKIYNQEEEYYLDNNGNKIEDKEKLEEIKQSNAILRIGNFKRVTYGLEQYYYIEEN